MNDLQFIASTEDTNKMTKLDLSDKQKLQINQMVSILPTLYTDIKTSNLYEIVFPDDLPNELMKLKQGGYSTVIQENGKILGTASAFKASSVLTVANAFSIMSVATGQYYLSEITDKLSIISDKIDNVMSFLYEDKKAELMSEIYFANYAYNNSAVIMQNESHKIATLTNLQNSKKIAFKDIAFYTNQLKTKLESGIKLDSKFDGNANDFNNYFSDAESAIQLYIISGLMEVLYSDSPNPEYTSSVINDMSNFIKTSELTLGTILNQMRGKISALKQKDNVQQYLTQIDDKLKNYNVKDDTKNIALIKDFLSNISSKKKYYVNSLGEVYLSKVS